MNSGSGEAGCNTLRTAIPVYLLLLSSCARKLVQLLQQTASNTPTRKPSLEVAPTIVVISLVTVSFDLSTLT